MIIKRFRLFDDYQKQVGFHPQIVTIQRIEPFVKGSQSINAGNCPSKSRFKACDADTLFLRQVDNNCGHGKRCRRLPASDRGELMGVLVWANPIHNTAAPFLNKIFKTRKIDEISSRLN